MILKYLYYLHLVRSYGFTDYNDIPILLDWTVDISCFLFQSIRKYCFAVQMLFGEPEVVL